MCLHYHDLYWIRTGDSRGFAFVRYKYADEAQKAVDRLDGNDHLNIFYVSYFCTEVACLLMWMFISGREVDGREITVQFAKYGPNAERM